MKVLKAKTRVINAFVEKEENEEKELYIYST
jgi:hypothetical protein